MIPLQIGVLQFPVPSARRCYKLGQALRRAIESFPEDINVAIVATGGLSHQVHGERCGFNNPDWDAQFVDMLVNDPEKAYRNDPWRICRAGGMEGSEVIMWLVMRGALSANVTETWRDYYLPVDDRYRHADPREQCAPAPVDTPDAPSPAYGAAAGRGGETAGNLSFLPTSAA